MKPKRDYYVLSLRLRGFCPHCKDFSGGWYWQLCDTRWPFLKRCDCCKTYCLTLRRLVVRDEVPYPAHWR